MNSIIFQMPWRGLEVRGVRIQLLQGMLVVSSSDSAAVPVLKDITADSLPDLLGLGKVPLGPKAPVPIKESNPAEEGSAEVYVLLDRILAALSERSVRPKRLREAPVKHLSNLFRHCLALAIVGRTPAESEKNRHVHVVVIA